MKFLVLALCVCAASAASFGYTPSPSIYKSQRFGQASVQTVEAAPKFVAVVPSAVSNAAYNVAQAFVAAPAAAVKTVKDAYNGKENEAAVLRFQSDVAADGYNFAYETGNGISAEAAGQLKKVDNADVITVQGGYRYTAPDGTPVVFSYVADENGYHPQSDLLPVGPAVPEAILRSLEYIRTHAKPEN